MKKFIAVLFCVAMVLSFWGCTKDDKKHDSEKTGDDIDIAVDYTKDNFRFAEKIEDEGDFNTLGETTFLHDVNSGEDAYDADTKNELKIGVRNDSTAHIYASEDFGPSAVVSYGNGATAVQALKIGKVDCVIIDYEPAKACVEANTGLKILETKYAVEDYAICFRKGDTELKNAINNALKELIADGSVKKIVDKYINNSGEELVGVPMRVVDTDKPNLVMATNAEFPPYEYIAGDKYYGIDIEIAKIIADKLGYDLIIENVAFDSIIPGVQAGKYDMGMAGMTVSDDRLKYVDFSDSYITNVQVVIVSEDSKIQSIEDLERYY